MGSGTQITSGNNGGPTAFNVRYAASTGNGTRIFYLRNNGVDIAQRTVSANCSGTDTWVGGVCTASAAPITNLTSTVAPTLASGALTQNTNVTFNGTVRNTGTTNITTPFTDNFTYCWGVGCAPSPMIGGHIGEAALSSGISRTDISASFTLANTGTLRVQHCIDSGTGAIPESDESFGDNCKIADFTVVAAGSPVLNFPGCDIPNGASSCIAPMSTVTGGSGFYNLENRTTGVNISNVYGSGWYNGGAGTPAQLARGTNTLVIVQGGIDRATAYPVASCNPGVWNAGTGRCEAAAASYSCTGSDPLNATLCSGDSTSLSADTAKTLVNSCGVPKCEYTCSSGYAYSGGNCVQPQVTQFTICDLGTNNNCSTNKTIPSGTDATLYWNSSNTDSCSGTGFSTGALPNTSGSVTVTATAAPQNFDIICVKGTTPVSPAPITLNASALNPTLTASPSIVKVGGSVTLTWDTNNGDETQCNLTGGNLGNSYSSLPGVVGDETGSTGLITISGRTTFTLTCPPSGTSVTRTVDVIPEGGET